MPNPQMPDHMLERMSDDELNIMISKWYGVEKLSYAQDEATVRQLIFDLNIFFTLSNEYQGGRQDSERLMLYAAQVGKNSAEFRYNLTKRQSDISARAMVFALIARFLEYGPIK